MTAWLRSATACALALAMVGEGASRARAEDSAARSGAEVGDAHRSLTLSAGSVAVDAVFEVSLSAQQVGQPISFAPDLQYGATDELTLGLVHSARGRTGIVGQVGNGLCLTGEDAGCAEVYDNVGVGAEYSVMEGDLDLAAEGGLHSANLSDPALWSLKAGLLARWSSTNLHVDFNPNVFFEVAARDENADTLNLPVTARVSVAPLDIGAQVGLRGELDALADSWALPLSVIAHYRVSEPLEVGAALSFPRLVAHAESSDIRALTLVARYRM